MKNNPTTQNIERIKEAKVVQVIEVLLNRGDGTENNPIRAIRQYYDFEGNLLVDLDDWKND